MKLLSWLIAVLLVITASGIVALAQSDCSQQEILTPSDTTEEFAESLSISGDTAVIGDEGDDGNGFNSGVTFRTSTITTGRLPLRQT